MILDTLCIADQVRFPVSIRLPAPEALWFRTLQGLVHLVHNFNGAGLQGLCRLVLLCARITLRYPVM
jgi:hypothetical protein